MHLLPISDISDTPAPLLDAAALVVPPMTAVDLYPALHELFVSAASRCVLFYPLKIRYESPPDTSIPYHSYEEEP